MGLFLSVGTKEEYKDRDYIIHGCIYPLEAYAISGMIIIPFIGLKNGRSFMEKLCVNRVKKILHVEE